MESHSRHLSGGKDLIRSPPARSALSRRVFRVNRQARMWSEYSSGENSASCNKWVVQSCVTQPDTIGLRKGGIAQITQASALLVDCPGLLFDY